MIFVRDQKKILYVVHVRVRVGIFFTQVPFLCHSIPKLILRVPMYFKSALCTCTHCSCRLTHGWDLVASQSRGILFKEQQWACAVCTRSHGNIQKNLFRCCRARLVKSTVRTAAVSRRGLARAGRAAGPRCRTPKSRKVFDYIDFHMYLYLYYIQYVLLGSTCTLSRDRNGFSGDTEFSRGPVEFSGNRVFSRVSLFSLGPRLLVGNNIPPLKQT